MVDRRTELMTVTEVAKKLRLGQSTVRHMITRDEVKGVKIGQQWRIFASSVERLLRGEDDVPDSSEKDNAAAGDDAESPAIAHRRAAEKPRSHQEVGRNGRSASGDDSDAPESQVILRHSTR